MSGRLATDRPRAAADIWCGVIVLAVAVLLPLIGASNYTLTQMTLFFIWAVVVTQWNLVFGIAGVLTLGHMAIFAVGGYTTAMLGLYFGFSPWASLPFAAAAAVVASLLMGAATLRLRGPYVAIMTLAISQAIYSLIMTDVECFTSRGGACQNLTGGARGLFGYGDFGFGRWLGFKHRLLGDYYLALAVLVIGVVFAFLVAYSAMGATFRAIRDNRICAGARGVDRVRYQFLVFALAGVFTGLAGGVYAGIQRTIGPDMFSITLLLFVLSMMVVGGRGTNWGPLLGAGALMLADTVLRDFPEIRTAALSLTILLFMLLLPRGLAGLVRDIVHWQPRIGRDQVPAARDAPPRRPARGGAQRLAAQRLAAAPTGKPLT